MSRKKSQLTEKEQQQVNRVIDTSNFVRVTTAKHFNLIRGEVIEHYKPDQQWLIMSRILAYMYQEHFRLSLMKLEVDKDAP